MQAQTQEVAGIRYFDLFRLRSFGCPPLRATLQPEACAAQLRRNREGSVCRTCSIGAQHAGERVEVIASADGTAAKKDGGYG